MQKSSKEWQEINGFLSSEKSSNIELGQIFKEYIVESAHGGWDGFSSHDVTGIRRFLLDFIIYFQTRQA